MRWLLGIGVTLIAVAVAGYQVLQNRLSAPVLNADAIVALRADAAAQNEAAFENPEPRARLSQSGNRLRNVYFGDLHVHSSLSFDSYIFGNRFDVDQSYRFAKGEAVENLAGETTQLTVPLDFAAITDHAEGFGLGQQCAASDASAAIRNLCDRMEQPGIKLFLELRKSGVQRPPVSLISGDAEQAEKTRLYAEQAWASIVATAEAHNTPGEFTTFAAYEYSPPLPDSGKIHRNVIFRSSDVPGSAVSAFDALTEIDLWKRLSTGCTQPCEFLTIPHNPNKTWGLAFAGQTIDGDAYTIDDWGLRDRYEPLVEMYQIKGNSECAIGFGTTDEECAFEQFLPRCAEDQVTGCIFPTSMVRDGLKKGLALEDELGFNPLEFGMIGSTDSHNSTPGDTEEWDYRGVSGFSSASAKRRLSPGRSGEYANLKRNPGGLAAIWAPENTRDALFQAMQRKEVYATSGTRIQLRFFASFAYDEDLATRLDAIEIAYSDGVPMGGRLSPPIEGAPRFLIWTGRDPLSAPLDKVQIIKGWTEGGEMNEIVLDVLCSEDRPIDPETGRCAATTASVDLSNCQIEPGRGAGELKTMWTDTDYQPGQNAFYYVRVLQNPTCRWSTYDALRLGREPPSNVPAVQAEMAWSSPIWLGR